VRDMAEPLFQAGTLTCIEKASLAFFAEASMQWPSHSLSLREDL
jgi:hypothetical protein